MIDPSFYDSGLYDWGDSDNSAPGSSESDQAYDQTYDQGGPAPLYPPPYPNQGPPYPNQGDNAPTQQPAAVAPAGPSAPERLLTVIFKSGRVPIMVRNYLMTTKVLTDLDSQHYEQIPLDQIDLAATRRINSAAGVDFQVPGT